MSLCIYKFDIDITKPYNKIYDYSNDCFIESVSIGVNNTVVMGDVCGNVSMFYYNKDI